MASGIGGTGNHGLTLHSIDRRADIRDHMGRANLPRDAFERIDTKVGSSAAPTRDLVAGGLLAAGGVASIAGGRSLASKLGATGAGRWIGAALGIGALAGAAYLLTRGATGGTTEYMVPFSRQPDLDGVPPGEVYATLRAHHERMAPSVERELAALLDEGKVRSYSGIIGANGFVVDVVNRHRQEVEERLESLAAVGDVERASLT